MMPAFNAELYIAEAIESVLAQSYTNWKLIIVDDGSNDRTAEIAADYKDERIQLISQINSGEAAARNTALDQMQGEFIAFLDSDDCYLPEHLAEAINILQLETKLDGVYTDGYHINAVGERGNTLSSRRRGPFCGNLFEELVRASDVFGPPLCVVLRRKPVFEQQLRFDRRIVIGPDWDFFTRFAENANFDYLAKQTCHYRLHTSNISFRTQSQKKALSLALCREKAIQLASFERCSTDTRTYAFYDVLVNLLAGFPERQTGLTEMSQFKQLPEAQQARLYRLMATGEIRASRNYTYVNSWLDLSRRLKPRDLRTNTLTFFFWLSPQMCRGILNLKEKVSQR